MSEAVPPPGEVVLGGGCFWCTEAIFRALRGVAAVECGYAGGWTDAPSYEDVVAERTGHAEVVRVTYGPPRTLADLVAVLRALRPGGRGHARSVLLVSPDALAEARMHAGSSIDVAVLDRFHRAEERHQRYAEKHPDGGYTCAVIAPKLAALRERFPHWVSDARTSSIDGSAPNAAESSARSASRS